MVVVFFCIHLYHQQSIQIDSALPTRAELKPVSTPDSPRRGAYMVPRSEPPAPLPVEQPSLKPTMPDGSIQARAPGLAKHAAAQLFLQSVGKDTVAGQTIARELIQNGYGPEYISIVYNSALALGLTNNIKTDDPATFIKIAKMREAAVKGRLASSGTISMPAITNTDLVDRLLALRPSKPYQDRPLIHVTPGPDGQLLTSQDILDYINAHPAIPSNAAVSSTQPAQ
jgi:hypothetical protein